MGRFNFDIPLPNQWTADEHPDSWEGDHGAWKEALLLKNLIAAEMSDKLDGLGEKLLAACSGPTVRTVPLPARTDDDVAQLYDIMVKVRTYTPDQHVPPLADLRAAYEDRAEQLTSDLQVWRSHLDTLDAANREQTGHSDPNPPGGAGPFDKVDPEVRDTRGRKKFVQVPDGRKAKSVKKAEQIQLHGETFAALTPEAVDKYLELTHPVMAAWALMGSPDNAKYESKPIKRNWIRDDFAILTPLLLGDEVDQALYDARDVPPATTGHITCKGKSVNVGEVAKVEESFRTETPYMPETTPKEDGLSDIDFAMMDPPKDEAAERAERMRAQAERAMSAPPEVTEPEPEFVVQAPPLEEPTPEPTKPEPAFVAQAQAAMRETRGLPTEVVPFEPSPEPPRPIVPVILDDLFITRTPSGKGLLVYGGVARRISLDQVAALMEQCQEVLASE
jgi:hypothetical protein